ncbi:T9SS sorting signal type C domain-containing protein [Flavobacterium bizetiae]|uniref:T9SS sorting signal type C domain-containing protein n=1 Tax=Flavobacterium bizetiae TaxID=2704140 RepID=UPI0021E7108C|nr:T9SS sorting signal type C domain-containing protein [Flavobacterium bizetiae]UTN05088.1 T9SS sorting signal type C domain-containing protein [Flavobacterium bizetiae]
MMKKLLFSNFLFFIDFFKNERSVTSKWFCLALLLLTNFGFGQIAQRGGSTTAITATTSLKINKPAGVVEGDVMIVNIAEEISGQGYIPGLLGWTPISAVYLGTSSRVGAVLYKVALANEPDNYTFELTNVIGAVGSIVAFSGVDVSGASPFDVNSPQIYAPNVNTRDVIATSLNTVTNNAAVIMFGQAAESSPTWDNNWSTNSPGGLVELYDNQKSDSGGRATVGAAWAIKSTAGNTGNGTVTLSTAQKSGGLLVALKPKPYYKSQIISANLGSSTWCAGETRTVSVVIKNVGSAPWADGGGKDFNIGIKWNGESPTIWNDYHVRVDAQNLAPGETKTYYFNITASRRTVSAYGAKLAVGSNNITFDVVSEGISWFKDNNGGVGPGNIAFVSPNQTIVASPDNKTVSAVNSTICIGTATNITVASSQSGVSYQLRNGTTNIGTAVNGTGGNINLPTGTLSTTTTFNVLATLTSSSCPLQLTDTPTVTVNSLSSAPVDTYTFCIDNSNTITTANVNSGQYALLNVVKGYKFTFRVGDVFSGFNEFLSVYDASNDALITSNNGTNGTSIIDWIPTFSGQVKILLTAGANCANVGTTGGTLTLDLTGGGNTLETQNEYGLNTWIGHIYNAGGISPEPFSSNYAGYYNVGSETINEGFGGNENCFAVYSGGVKRASIFTEGFAVRYKMKTNKSGCYIIRVTGDDGIRLFMNNTKIFDRWGEQGSTTYNDILVRLDGDDDFVFDYYENEGGNVVGFTLIAFDANANNITAPSIVNFCPNGDPGIIGGSLQYTLADVNLQNPQLNFQWQLSTDGGTYGNIPGATGRTYDPSAIQNTTTANIVRRFKRLVSFDTSMPNINNVKTNCGYNESNIVTITTNPSPSVPTVGTIINVGCNNLGSIELSDLPLGAWTITQSSTTGTITIPGSGTTFKVSNLPIGTYKFTVTDATCTSQLTNDIIIKDQSSTTYNGTWSNGLPDATKNVTFASAFPIIADMNACSCTINSGVTMTVPSGVTLNVTNALTILGTGSLTFNNSASLIQNQNTRVNSNSGNIFFKRNTAAVRRKDYTYWSSPVSNFTLHDLSSGTYFDKYYRWNPSTGWIPINYGADPMIQGVGYIVRAPESHSLTVATIYNATFIGVPNNGDVNVIPVGGKFNLIGNPYPSALDAVEFIKANTPPGNETIAGAVYFWTHNTPPAAIDPAQPNKYFYTTDDYAVLNLSGTVVAREAAESEPDKTKNIPTGNIASGQGFFVRALTNAAIKFNNKMRLAGADNSQFFKTTGSNEKDRLWLNFKNNEGAFKQLLVAYVDGATNSWDNNYDATTYSASPYVDFYSVNETKKLTIQGRALPFENSDQVALGYKSTVVGQFTISIDHTEGLFNQQAIYLEDKATGIISDLRTSDYSFTTQAGTFTDRFVLRYTNKTLGSGDFENIEDGILISVKNKTVNVLSSKENIKNVTIFDITGKTLYNKNKVSNIELQIQNLPSSNQVLLVKVTLDNGATVTRKIIFQ